jgi:hypothetical protein
MKYTINIVEYRGKRIYFEKNHSVIYDINTCHPIKYNSINKKQ